jgi:hypothetical protein
MLPRLRICSGVLVSLSALLAGCTFSPAPSPAITHEATADEATALIASDTSSLPATPPPMKVTLVRRPVVTPPGLMDLPPVRNLCDPSSLEDTLKTLLAQKKALEAEIYTLQSSIQGVELTVAEQQAQATEVALLRLTQLLVDDVFLLQPWLDLVHQSPSSAPAALQALVDLVQTRIADLAKLDASIQDVLVQLKACLA